MSIEQSRSYHGSMLVVGLRTRRSFVEEVLFEVKLRIPQVRDLF